MKPRNDGSGGSVRYSSPTIHPVDYVLNWRVNRELSPYQFVETMVGWALMRGNGYAEIERDGVGRVIALWLIEPWRVQLMRKEDGELFYRIDNDVDLALEDVFHIRGFGNGPVGLSVIDYAAQTIGWAQATELFGATYFGEGTHVGAAVQLKGRASTDSIERMREETENRHQGVGRSHRWLFFDNDAEVTKLGDNANESQFVETMYLQVEQICRFFGVPPQKVQHLLRATFSNVEQQSIDVVGDAIVPWAMRFEQEGTFKLFGSNRQFLFLKMDVKGLLRGDFATRQTGLQILRRNAIINSDDWADLEDMPRPKMGGDKYIIEGNMTTIDMVGEMPTAPNPSPSADTTSLGALRLRQMARKKREKALANV